MAMNTPTFRKSVGSVAMQSTYNTIVYDYYPLVSVADRPIFWDARYSQEWASGKVSYEHNKLLSSGIGHTAVQSLNKKILGGKLIYKKGKDTDNAKKTVDFIRKKATELKLDELTGALSLKGLSGGSSYFVLNPAGKDVQVDAIGIDQAYVTFRGFQPVKAKIFINFIDDNSGRNISSSRYFLVEERYFKEGKPYTINKIYKSPIPQMEGAYQSFSYGWALDQNTDALDVTDIFINNPNLVDPYVYKYILESNLIFGYEFELPFKGLGIIHYKNTETSLKHPNSKYGEPVLSSSYDLMWAYDYAFSILAKDLYVGRAMTFIPDTLNGNQVVESQMTDEQYANAFYNRAMPLPALYDDEFIKVPNYSMDYQQPTTVQFDIRADKIKTAMDTLATKIAQNVGIDPVALISEMTPTNETKTAFEVSNEASIPNTTILRKRELLQQAINELIDELCYFYGKSSEDVTVCFPPLEELNKTLTADYIVKLRSVNGMSVEMLVDLAYKDLTEAEKTEEIDRIKRETEEREKQFDKENLNNQDNNLRKSKERKDVDED